MDICYFLSLLVSRLVQVQISDGIIQGEIVNNEYNKGCPYYSFKGIPYAEPPVGDLRFKAPQPKQTWEGILNATEHGPRCHQGNPYIRASEDCLYLNVYSPNIAPEQPLPVMVYVHGGGFVTGSGDDEMAGPKFLLRKNVILVTLNYRLGALGFLSMDIEDAPGNAGMKDQVAALRWVKKNIHKFGGNPDNVTLFGISAGGACVSFHLVSPMSKGLFNRAITQSGTLTSWFSNQFRARDRALILAKDLGFYSTDDKEILEFLKRQPAENLIGRSVPISFWQSAKEGQTTYFTVTPERQFGDKERFFYGESYDVLRSGVHEGIEVMNGYTQDEGILFFAAGINATKVFEQANHFLEYFVPEPYTVHTPLTTQFEIGRRFKDFYMQNKVVSKETLDDILKYVSMEVFVYGTMSQQQIIAKRNRNKTFLYKFTCHSELNQFITHMGLEDLFDYRDFVAHAEDSAYIFTVHEVDLNSREFKMVDQVTTLWTNFAKYGDPTPDDTLGVKWFPYSIENQEYLNIGEVLVSSTFPEREELDFWQYNFREFLPQFVP